MFSMIDQFVLKVSLCIVFSKRIKSETIFFYLVVSGGTQ